MKIDERVDQERGVVICGGAQRPEAFESVLFLGPPQHLTAARLLEHSHYTHTIIVSLLLLPA